MSCQKDGTLVQEQGSGSQFWSLLLVAGSLRKFRDRFFLVEGIPLLCRPPFRSLTGVWDAKGGLSFEVAK